MNIDLNALNRKEYFGYRFIVDFRTTSSIVYLVVKLKDGATNDFDLVGEAQIHFRESPPFIVIYLSIKESERFGVDVRSLMSSIRNEFDPENLIPYRWSYIFEEKNQRKGEANLKTEMYDSRGFLE